MREYLQSQVLTATGTLVLGLMLVFSIVRLVPGDPVYAVLDVEQTNITPELYEATARRLGVDRPFHEQLFVYLIGLARLDLGASFRNGRPVLLNLAEHAPFSFHLAVGSILVTLLVGVPAGVVSAVRHNTAVDRISMVVALQGLCIPNFLLGLLLIILFSGTLGWLPTFGVGSPGDVRSLILHAILPSLTLGTSAAGLQARIVRSSLLEVLGQDYIRTARSKGLSERTVIFRHGLRNAFSPILTILGLDFVRLLTGTVIVETIFGRKGLGKLMVDSIFFRDYPQIQACLMVFLIMIIVVNLITDLTYVWLDPRIRFGAAGG